jgi:hypothetical protein
MPPKMINLFAIVKLFNKYIYYKQWKSVHIDYISETYQVQSTILFHAIPFYLNQEDVYHLMQMNH